MANVTMAMEQMLPEFKDYEKKNLFSKVRGVLSAVHRSPLTHSQVEIKSIAAKRQKLETALGKKTPSQSDYLRYIEYEITLENLKRKRMTRLKVALTPSPALYGIQKRILQLFDKATSRFRSDISLWLKYIEYLKKVGANKLLSRTFARVINLHPANPQLYILAASWELNNNVSAHSARTLLQRGLRLNSKDLELWLTYARMELVFAERVRRRLEFDQKFDEAAAAENSEGVEKGLDAEDTKAANTDVHINSNESDKKVMDGAIVIAIIDNAKQTLPPTSQFTFFSSLISLIREFPLPVIVKHNLLNHTYQTLRLALPEDADARLLIAVRADENAPEEAGVVDKVEGLDVACNAVTTVMVELQQPAMTEKGLQWLIQRYQKEDDDNLKQYLSHFINTSFKSSKSKKLLTPAAHLSYINHLRTSSADEDKVTKLVNDALSKHPHSSKLHLLKLDLQPSNAAYQAALTSCPAVWELYERFLYHSLNGLDAAAITKLFEKLLVDALQGEALIKANAEEYERGHLTVHDRLLKMFVETNASHNLVQLPSHQLFPPSFVTSPSPRFYEWILDQDSSLDHDLVKELYRKWAEHPQSDSVQVTLRLAQWLLSINKSSQAFGAFSSTIARLTNDADKVRLESGWQSILAGGDAQKKDDSESDTLMEE
ncbi:hypothetical protein E3P99_02964 [Wallemia hederae]|uniref:U3 small nucleolar RNA-associated protein 6 N-terminal domain-containing protein n=1 Tax=Wallemia hederae TaxID=1540922 RepID=A0A4T0FHJ6_9BASI|nr:hypothetical protein E3P99_02964 [Wallemia hederae]